MHHAKVEEITSNPIPPPRLNIAALPDAVRLTWTTNSAGYRLETNSVLTLTNGWGVLTTNYSVIGTNYAVTNSVNEVLPFEEVGAFGVTLLGIALFSSR